MRRVRAGGPGGSGPEQEPRSCQTRNLAIEVYCHSASYATTKKRHFLNKTHRKTFRERGKNAIWAVLKFHEQNFYRQWLLCALVHRRLPAQRRHGRGVAAAQAARTCPNSACARTRHRSTPPPPTCPDHMHDTVAVPAQVHRTRANCPDVEPPYPIPIRDTNATGFRGVTKATSCFQAKLFVENKEVQLGSGQDVSASLPPPACPHSTSPQLVTAESDMRGR